MMTLNANFTSFFCRKRADKRWRRNGHRLMTMWSDQRGVLQLPCTPPKQNVYCLTEEMANQTISSYEQFEKQKWSRLKWAMYTTSSQTSSQFSMLHHEWKFFPTQSVQDPWTTNIRACISCSVSCGRTNLLTVSLQTHSCVYSQVSTFCIFLWFFTGLSKSVRSQYVRQ